MSNSALVIPGLNHENSNWQWPKIEGFHLFKGHKCHSASWDEEYDYSNKTIAVIGNGSSGVQIIPQLAKLPSTKVICFQRNSNFVYSPFTPASLLGREDSRENPPFTEEDNQRFREDPAFHREYRRTIVHRVNGGFRRVSTILLLLLLILVKNSMIAVYQRISRKHANYVLRPRTNES